MIRFSARAELDLREAGWVPGRTVDTSRWRQMFEMDGLLMHDAADRFLAEFGGLMLDISGPGMSSAREPFELDPADLDSEVGRFVGWGRRLGVSLFPIGELDRGRFFLGISEKSEIFLVETWVASFGFGDAGLDNLIVGVAPREITC